MKKLTLIALLAFFGTANAQTETATTSPTAKGNWIIGGSTNLGFNSNKATQKSGDYSVDGQKTTTFNVTPTVGYFVIDNLAVGLNLGYEVQKQDASYDFNQTAKVTNTVFSVIPSVTYFIEADSKAFPYISAGAGYAAIKTKVASTETQNDNFFVWGGKAGLAYFITPSIAIDLGLNYQQLSTKYEETFSTTENKVIFKTLGASIGFNFVL
ncbi:MAG: OmpW family outer membrane protein [Myroides sp.]